MIRDLEVSQPDPSEVADVCIVGAGAAGIVIAVELIRQGKRVVLLEGGGADVEERSQETYRSEVVGNIHRGVHTGRFRAKGGTTTRWGGQILEFEYLDFIQRPWIAESGWPFSKDELRPYYERALELEGLGGVIRKDESVWRKIGVEPPSFDGLHSYFSRWCPEPSFARLHRAVLEENASLVVWLHANAVEMIFHADRMIGVRCRTLTGVEATFRASRFVFCLGAIESSRFFLQPSAAGFPWNRSGLLGRHFQDHIDVNAAEIEPIDSEGFHRIFDNIFREGFKYHPKLRLSSSIQQERRTLNVAATMSFISNADEALGRLKETAKKILRGRVREVAFADVVFVVKNLPLLVRQTLRYAIQNRAYNPSDAAITLRVHCEQQPDSTSSITLSDERDALGLYRTRLDWQISDKELAAIREYVLIAQCSLAGIARVIPDPDLVAGKPEFRAKCDDSNHHMGGMRMAVDPEDGVVDPNLRLHGTANIYVCSGAVFPTSSFSNPTHTVLALAVRLADHLAGDLG
ncbi:GMC oxidoreductase [Granulicella sibirica]|uniref:Glucose-methanol-choline (GMC) oxidoreductase:NAD binding site n=1 Tax=Granulicella sibirica TaxID=2479048 RepID=A0A4Q0T316_9BACT|nr:GMC family oxidoreductase [Granulicella sibirica]RXH56850.1 Glucose-methanol-choline (GMC) oxidoreductase:NAD binding site [Granulicella sibirica]